MSHHQSNFSGSSASAAGVPSDEDVELLRTFVEAECSKAIEELKSDPSQGKYHNLQEVTLVMTLLSYYRRNSELENLEFCAFNTVLGRLTFGSKKGGNTVLLLPPILQCAFRYLMDHRNIVVDLDGCSKFFALSSSSTLKLPEILKNMVVRCSARQANLLTSHGLRMFHDSM